MAEKLLMVSLEEDKAKELAQVISNESCRKILNFLSENEASEGDIVKKLNLPASTVHYNIRLLFKNKLIEVKDTLWSAKGNKVNIYKVANKLIVIAPKKTSELRSKLKGILPIAVLAVIVSVVVHFFSNRFAIGIAQESARSFETIKSAGVDMAEAVAMEVAPSSINVINVVPNYGLWFLFGALFVIVIYILISLWKVRKR